MHYRVTTAPTVEWIQLYDLKAFLRYTGTAEDQVLEALITSVRVDLERELGISMINQAVTVWLDAEEVRSPIFLPLGPVRSVTSVKYYNDAGSSTTVSTGNYRVTTGVLPARLIELSSGITTDRTEDAVEIIYQAGFGTDETSIPAPLVEAMKRRLARRFLHRGDPVVGMQVVDIDVSDLVAPWRVETITTW